jgi:biopolymer transport protein TolR
MGAALGSGRMGGRRSGKGRRRGRGGAMSEINVTPFVDVMLVLLIVFMVAAPLLTVGVPVNLPKTDANPLPTEQREPVTVNVDTDGTIFLQGDPVTGAELRERLSAISAERGSDERVFVRADKAVGYGEVMEVMGLLNAADFRNIGLVTDPGGPVASGIRAQQVQ